MKKAKNATKSLEPIGLAQNMKAAASRSKLPLAMVQAAKDAGAKAFHPSGRIDCDALIEFVATMPDKPDDAPDYYLERAKDLRAARQLKEQKLREREKLSWPVERVKSAWRRNVVALKTKLAISENAVSVEASMRLNFTSEQVAVLREIHAKHNRAALKEMFVGDWGKVECPHCAKEILP